MVRQAIWVGMGECVLFAVPIALGLLVALGWGWSIGLLWGVATVGVGRLVRWGFLSILLREGRNGRAAGGASLARYVLVALLAVGGVLAGLPPLAVAGGLLLPSVGLWCWTVRVARTSG
ncbi:MAG: hypothetical protein BIP78_0656 [Candidatus Bipolaricaulis sibiricus]|uniref:ATP synthase protein I2 n=1 Tax=Bipolaricaulis sibiricus TaxID=2501609 RepID=A0A410FTV5_BIPS1|nr:MAG: hypothetical protein BIP78_0656 [Candidatus Bipolaricaulis sibiricus]